MDWIVGVVVLGGSMAIGMYISLHARSSESSNGFFLAGRRMRWPIVGGSLYATNIGAEHLVGLSGDAYRYGLCAGAVELTTAICLGFACAVLFPYYIQNKVFTIPEFLELRYNRAARTFFSGLMLVISIMTKTAFCLFAGALVLHSLVGWDVMGTVAGLGLLTAVFTIVGGFAAVAFTDSIQTVIMIVGCGAMSLIGLHRIGGWHELVARVPEAMHIAKPYTDPVYPFWGVIAGAVYGGTFYWGIDQVNVQRVLGAPDLRQARWGAMLCVLLKLTPVFIFALPGVIAFALYPELHGDETKQTFVLLLNRLLPTGLRGFVLAALIAALTSSLTSVMNSVATMAVRDFILPHRPGMPDRTQVTVGRAVIVVAMALGVGAAYFVYISPEGLYKYLQTISIYLVLPVTPAIVFGIMSRRVTFAGAAASVGVGVALAAVFVIDQLVGPETGAKLFPWLHHTLTLNYTYRGLWGTLAITLTLFLVSAFTTKTEPGKLDKTTIHWGRKPEPFEGLKDWRLHLAALGIATVLLYWWVW
jgi:SSS family solute:Na+ symporter